MMSLAPDQDGPPPEYAAALTQLEERAARGELTIAQARSEILALRERFCVETAAVMRWAVREHTQDKT